MWQFICSVPVMVLEDFLPWMMSYLSHEERNEVVNCMKDVVPNEDSLQQVCTVYPLLVIYVLYPFLSQIYVLYPFLVVSDKIKGFLKVISSWLVDCGASTKILKQVQYEDVSKDTKNLSRSGCFQRLWQWSKKPVFIPNVGHSPIHSLQLFQNAVEKDLKDIQEGLCQVNFPSLLLDLDVLMARLNFLADVLVSYR